MNQFKDEAVNRAPAAGRPPQLPAAAVVVAVVIGLAIWGGLALGGDPRQPLARTLLLLGAASALYLVLLGGSRWGDRLTGAGYRWMLLGGVLFRVLLVPADPGLSDDLYRYIWDGRVLVAGHNPFRHAPAAPELAPLRDRWHARINHPDVPTIYPPAAQVVFAAMAAVAPHPLTVKAGCAVLDLLVLVALARLLAVLGLPRGRLLAYAWCPLPIIEFAGSGHIDVLGILALVVALAALEARRPAAAVTALGVAVLSKLLPIVVAPLVLARVRRRHGLLLVAVVVAGYLPFVAGGVDPTVGLRTYLAHWRGNEALFGLLLGAGLDLAAAKLMAALLVLVVAAVLVARRVATRVAVPVTLAAALLLSPVVHPWYLTWLVPFIGLMPSVALAVLACTVLLAYRAWGQLAAHGVYRVDALTRSLEYLPPLVAVGFDIARAGGAGVGRRMAGRWRALLRRGWFSRQRDRRR
ncbi:MAG: hypothetical protein PVF43_13155 [Candidatus Eiseniibacteriota bacterium]